MENYNKPNFESWLNSFTFEFSGNEIEYLKMLIPKLEHRKKICGGKFEKLCGIGEISLKQVLKLWQYKDEIETITSLIERIRKQFDIINQKKALFKEKGDTQ